MTSRFKSEFTHSSILVDTRMQEVVSKRVPTEVMTRRDPAQSTVRVVSVTIKVD